MEALVADGAPADGATHKLEIGFASIEAACVSLLHLTPIEG